LRVGIIKFLGSWRRPLVAPLVVWVSIASPGCGEPAERQGRAMPPPEFSRKLMDDHPELFKKKTGKRAYGDVSIRERREIIRQEWEKTQGTAK